MPHRPSAARSVDFIRRWPFCLHQSVAAVQVGTSPPQCAQSSQGQGACESKTYMSRSKCKSAPRATHYPGSSKEDRLGAENLCSVSLPFPFRPFRVNHRSTTSLLNFSNTGVHRRFAMGNFCQQTRQPSSTWLASPAPDLARVGRC